MARSFLPFRRVSHRSFTTVLIVSVLAISLRTLVYPHPFHFPWSRTLEPEYGRPSLGKHTVTPDGRLVVNPDGSHPIFQLIHDAEVAWETKRARASKTFDEAVAEYRRRYRRAPPLGFDKWWDYVMRHHILLPDEYDEIFEDIEPFMGINPQDLARNQQELEMRDGVVTVEKTDAQPRLEIVHSTLPKDRERELQDTIRNIIAVVREVEHDLPPLRITFSPYDNPDMLSDWQIKTMALEAAANGTTLTRADLPPITELGWIQGCAPDSPARLHPPSYPPPSIPPFPHSSPKTFIASHRETMDPCMHPEMLTEHGQFLSHKVGPFPRPTLVPRFSLCSTLLHHDIRPPMPYGWDFNSDPDPVGDGKEDAEADGGGAYDGDLPWERKTKVKLGWRGRSTGIWASPDSWWVNAHRARLVTLTNALEGNVSVFRVPVTGEEANPVGEPMDVSLALANMAWMDVAFTEKPIGCDGERGTCDEMAQMWTFREVQEREQEGQYKFILDVDGNGWSGRFKRLITSNALVFKATVYPEWYTSRIEPWVHYVPIQVSYADLYDAASFFRVQDGLARRIARAGQAWSRRYWRKADMTAYFYRLLLEYARVMSLDREAMDYVG